MSSIKSKGLVLKETKVGEYDKRVTLLLKETGKVTAYSKGARKATSKFLTGTQLFSYSEYVLFSTNRFLSTSHIEIIDNFYNIRTDYDKLCYGTYFLELTDKVVLENLQVDDILYLLLRTLHILNRKTPISRENSPNQENQDEGINIKLICAVFNFKFLKLNGYEPILSNCFACQKEIFHKDIFQNETKDNYYFSSDGLVCGKCKQKNHYIEVSYSTVYSINYILSSSINDIYKFNLQEGYVDELYQASFLFLRSHLDVNLKSLDMMPTNYSDKLTKKQN